MPFFSHQVPWPVDIVISSECQKIYNQVFLLLLQIKWAKYSLDTLRFSGELGFLFWSFHYFGLFVIKGERSKASGYHNKKGYAIKWQ